ncbi:MAG: AMP-binding protein [Bacteriovoracaceae bacterium]|jgi:fatty-acyl-CoA synthase|nr:hypothetical protein [Halobacteriovoraceae bacterium]MDP7319445.1 AMP-binding protein [Bacteriovoracaceae bacterium]
MTVKQDKTTLVDILFKNHSVHDHFISFLLANGQKVDFQRELIKQKSTHLATKIKSVAADENILLEGSNSLDFIIHFFAIILSGNTPVPVTTSLWINEKRYQETIKSIKETTKAKIILGSKLDKGLHSKLGLKTYNYNDWEEIPAINKDLSFPNPTDTAFIQFSSGSTGNPKGVVLSHYNVIANIKQITEAIDNKELGNTVLSWLPVHHDMGLIGGLLVPLYNQYKVYIMTPYDFAVNPARWLKAISQYKANIIVGPNSAYNMTAKKVKQKTKESLNLSSVRIALCGAEPINAQTLDFFYREFKQCGLQKEAFVPCYGMAENTLAISFHQGGTAFKTEKISKRSMLSLGVATACEGDDCLEYVSCGQPLNHVDIKIVDNDGQTLPERHVGNILVKSPSTTQGYYQRDDLNKDLFHNGYLKTGDLGYISNKEIFVTGRKKDLIIVNGININAEEIEAYAIRMKEIKPGRLAAFALKDSKTDSEKIHLVIETRREYQYLLPRKRKQLQKKVSDTISNFFPIKEEQVSIVPPGSIKKTTSGKVQRSKMKQLFLNGKLKSENFILNFFLGQMRENQIKLKVFITGLKPRNFKGA